jgi:predicted permease
MKHVLRRLMRAPMFTAISLITLAIGIGANTAIFSVIEGILLKPLPYTDPDHLVGVWHTASGLNIKELNASPSNYFTYRDENRTFEDIGLYTGGSVSVTEMGDPEQVQTLFVTDGTLPVLGVKPWLGRLFTRQDDVEGSPETVVLTYGYWQRRFGGAASVIGRRIVVDGRARQIIGVAPRSFRFMHPQPELVIPLQFNRGKTFLGNFSYRAVARLKPGVNLAQANADVARMLPIWEREFPPPPGFNLAMFHDARIGPNVRPFAHDVVGDVGDVLWVLMGTIGVVLLIACANVANLLLVRAEGRQQELAIRAALGAGRGRIARELLFESVTLGLAGGALGLAVAYAALRLLVAIGPASLPRLDEISIDLPVLAFTVGVSLLVGLLFGALPVFRYAGARLGTGLRQGGRTLSQSRERHRARGALVVVQVSLALVLLISSGLMIRTFFALRQVQPGFTQPEQVLTMRVSIPKAQVKEPERAVHMFEDILGKIASVPGVRSDAVASSITMDGSNSNDLIFAEDHPIAEGRIPPVRRFKFIGPGLFATTGNPLVAGRDVTWTDLYNFRPVVLVSENMAREYWRDAELALGKRIRESPKSEWREIVGVVKDEYDDGVQKKPPAIVYWPLLQKSFWGDEVSLRRTMAFAVRSSRTGSAAFLNEIRQAVWSVSPNSPLADVRTLDEIYRKSMARTSFTLVVLAIAGSMALVLGLVGIYGVIAYSVSQRRREIGIRMALGARRQAVSGMFIRYGMMLAGIGVVCGLAAAAALMRLLSSLLFGVTAGDPSTYGVMAVSLVAAAVLASYLPARRASAVDPVETLRAE